MSPSSRLSSASPEAATSPAARRRPRIGARPETDPLDGREALGRLDVSRAEMRRIFEPQDARRVPHWADRVQGRHAARRQAARVVPAPLALAARRRGRHRRVYPGRRAGDARSDRTTVYLVVAGLTAVVLYIAHMIGAMLEREAAGPRPNLAAARGWLRTGGEPSNGAGRLHPRLGGDRVSRLLGTADRAAAAPPQMVAAAIGSGDRRQRVIAAGSRMTCPDSRVIFLGLYRPPVSSPRWARTSRITRSVVGTSRRCAPTARRPSGPRPRPTSSAGPRRPASGRRAELDNSGQHPGRGTGAGHGLHRAAQTERPVADRRPWRRTRR